MFGLLKEDRGQCSRRRRGVGNDFSGGTEATARTVGLSKL